MKNWIRFFILFTGLSLKFSCHRGTSGISQATILGTTTSSVENRPCKSAFKPENPATAGVILANKVGFKAGSNEGGFYLGSDGVERYVKFYQDEAQSWGEHLAALIYRDLSLGAPETQTFSYHGKQVFASHIIQNTNLLRYDLNKATAFKVLEGFVADILVGNWDSVGSNYDNMIVHKETGQVFRIDSGGAFLMRAQAGRKQLLLLNKITEWDGFRNPNLNQTYSFVFNISQLNQESFQQMALTQINKVVALRAQYQGWKNYVTQRTKGLNKADQDLIIAMLESRTNLLIEKMKELI